MFFGDKKSKQKGKNMNKTLKDKIDRLYAQVGSVDTQNDALKSIAKNVTNAISEDVLIPLEELDEKDLELKFAMERMLRLINSTERELGTISKNLSRRT